jgi:hypothetical protein
VPGSPASPSLSGRGGVQPAGYTFLVFLVALLNPLRGKEGAMKLIEHKDGCGGPASYSLKMVGDYNAYPSSHVNDICTLDGTTPPVGEPLRCGTCGKIWHMVEESVIRVRDD